MRVFAIAQYLTIVYADTGFFSFIYIKIVKNSAIIMRGGSKSQPGKFFTIFERSSSLIFNQNIKQG